MYRTRTIPRNELCTHSCLFSQFGLLLWHRELHSRPALKHVHRALSHLPVHAQWRRPWPPTADRALAHARSPTSGMFCQLVKASSNPIIRGVMPDLAGITAERTLSDFNTPAAHANLYFTSFCVEPVSTASTTTATAVVVSVFARSTSAIAMCTTWPHCRIPPTPSLFAANLFIFSPCTLRREKAARRACARRGEIPNPSSCSSHSWPEAACMQVRRWGGSLSCLNTQLLS